MGAVDSLAMVNGSGNGISKLSAGKYRRMDAQLEDDEQKSNILEVKGSGSSDSRKYVLVCAIFASLNSVLLGYDVGVMSGAIIFIQKDIQITEVQQEILVGSLSFVSILGSLAGGRTSDAIGRKWTIGLAAILFQVGAAIMTCAPNFLLLMIGRLLAGVGIGFGVMIAPVYIAEISPTVSRGSLTSFPEICINIGILLGYVSNYAFSGLSEHLSWRVMLGVGIIPSVFIGGALFVIPESPRWLVMQKRVDEARSVLLMICESAAEAEERLADIEEAAGTSNLEKHEEKGVWQELLHPSAALRRMMFTGFGIQCFQQLSGIDASVYYSPTIFRDVGIESDSKVLAATVAVGFTKTIFILVAIFLIDRLGRKPLLYVSTIGMTVCLFGLALSLALLAEELVPSKLGIMATIFAVCGNVAFFSVGLGPICWVLSSEIFPLKVRAQACAIGAVGNRICSGLIAMTFLSLTEAISVAGTFFIFSSIAALSVVFVRFFVPETKGKSLEQIENMFQSEREWQGSEVELGDVEHLVLRESKSSINHDVLGYIGEVHQQQ